MLQSESSRWFPNIDKNVSKEPKVFDADQSVLETVESIKLEPTCTSVQQLRSESQKTTTTTSEHNELLLKNQQCIVSYCLLLFKNTRGKWVIVFKSDCLKTIVHGELLFNV